MAEESNLVLANTATSLGNIEIAPEVLEIIVGIAASKVKGVYQMRGSFASSVNEWFGRVNHGKGVTLTREEDGLKVNVYCYLDYGVSVPKIALAMQEKVKEQMLFMTDLELAEVNVHVVGVVPEKAATISAEELFADHEEDGDVN